MKSIVYLRPLIFAFLLTIAWSCDIDKAATDAITDEQQSAQMENIIAADLVVEDTDMYFDMIIEMDKAASDRSADRSKNKKRELPDCAVVTSEMTNNYKTVTIDFGEACTFDEDSLSGVITFTFERDPDLHQKTITKTFTDFTFNGKTINGTTTLLRTKSNADANPQSTKSINLAIVLEDGTTVTKNGTKVKTFYFDPDAPKHKAKYTITGNWELVASDGWSKSVTVTTPLVKAARCKFFVSGTMDIVKGDAAFEVDFGDGNCDREATLTFADGSTKTIKLKR